MIYTYIYIDIYILVYRDKILLPVLAYPFCTVQKSLSSVY